MASVIAQLKAVLGIDTEQYRTGMTEAEKVTHSFATKVQDAERKLNNTSRIGQGFAQILRGQVASGLNSIVQGLDLVTSKAAMAVAKIGAVFAAFGAGWAVGKALDEKFGISDKLSKQMVQTQLDEDLARRNREFRAQRKSMNRATDVNAETDDLEASRLKGEAKLTQQYEKEKADILKLQRDAVSKEEKQAYDRRLDVLRRFYEADVEAFRKAEWEKEARAQQAAEDYYRTKDEAIAGTNKAFDERKKAIVAAEYRASGRDIRHDALAAVGGLVGGSRASIGAADKMLQKMIEDARRQDEIAKLNKEQAEALAAIEAKMPNGGQP